MVDAVTWEGLTPPYRTIVADPPWHYQGRVSGPRTPGQWHSMVSKSFPYSMLEVDQIAAMPVADLADEECTLLLWTTNRYLRDAFDVVDAWGFGYTQTLVWHKTGDPSPFGPALAPNHAEFLVVGTVGRSLVRERWASSVIAHIRSRRHSEKPALFLDLIERALPGPYCELFAHAPRLGWDHWGYGYEGVA